MRTFGWLPCFASTRRRHRIGKPGSETGRLEGKAALVTGASNGLGRATAIALARAGADVALVARSQQELDGAKGGDLEDRPPGADHPRGTRSEDETTAAVGRTVEALGRVDMLVNAAARMRPVR
jgi:NAD(P)-dependent dehydrogenase (short-subunit alcohol dehydrogenase family)